MDDLFCSKLDKDRMRKVFILYFSEIKIEESFIKVVVKI